MLHYFVVSIQKIGAETPCTITGYSSREEACSAYHSTLASNYISETMEGFSVVLMNEHGGTEMKEYWERPTT